MMPPKPERSEIDSRRSTNRSSGTMASERARAMAKKAALQAQQVSLKERQKIAQQELELKKVRFGVVH